MRPIKYREAIFDYKERCNRLNCDNKKIKESYEIKFEQEGIDANQGHYLLSASPKQAPEKIIEILKSINSARLISQTR